jgi:hypothetical protein
LEVGSPEVGFWEEGYYEAGSLEVGFFEVGSSEDGFSEEGSHEEGSVEFGPLEVGYVKIERSTVFLGYSLLCASEHIQDRLDVSSRTEWLRRSRLLRPFNRFGSGFVPSRCHVRGPFGGPGSLGSVLPNVSRKDLHNRAVVPLWRVPSDPFESIDATETYLQLLVLAFTLSVAPSWSIARVKRSVTCWSRVASNSCWEISILRQVK